MHNELSEEQVKALYEHTSSLVKAGKSKAEVQKDLLSRGLNDERALAVANHVFEIRGRNEAGRKNILYGALWCIGGIVVTTLNYQAAASTRGGGRYFVAWGAIVWGAIQFFIGLGQTGLVESTLPPRIIDQVHNCPACGQRYRLGDYNLDVEHIFCSSCKAEIPKHKSESNKPIELTRIHLR